MDIKAAVQPKGTSCVGNEKGCLWISRPNNDPKEDLAQAMEKPAYRGKEGGGKDEPFNSSVKQGRRSPERSETLFLFINGAKKLATS